VISSEDIERAKQDLRERMNAWRRATTAAQRRRWSERIVRHLWDWHPWPAGGLVLVYRSLRLEPETASLVRHLLAEGTRVVEPVADGPPGVRWWTAEPAARRSSQEVAGPPLAAIHVVLVPGLAFDRGGGRLGRGRGYYDRLLAELAPHCLRIGVAFAGQVVERVPRQAWDLPVGYLVTEDGVAPCRGASKDG